MTFIRARNRFVACLVALACALLGTLPAGAQSPQGAGPQGRPQTAPPLRGLFGGGSQDPTRAQSLDVSLSTSGDYIANMTRFSLLPGQAADPRLSDSYFMSGANAGLSYARR